MRGDEAGTVLRLAGLAGLAPLPGRQEEDDQLQDAADVDANTNRGSSRGLGDREKGRGRLIPKKNAARSVSLALVV